MISEALAILETDEERTELSEFYKKNKNCFYAVARSKLSNAQDIEDAVQEAFVRIAKKPDKFFSLEDPKRVAYVNVMIRNIAIDIYNKLARNANSSITNELIDYTIDPGTSLEDDLLGKISCEELMQFIGTLPDIQRDILTMHCMLDMPLQEIADKFDISLATTKKRLHQAREAIKNYISQKG